jgi:hypothetical protein
VSSTTCSTRSRPGTASPPPRSPSTFAGTGSWPGTSREGSHDRPIGSCGSATSSSLTPGAVALAWSRARWPLFVFGAGAVAIPVQAAGIAQTDLEAVGPFSAGQWVAISALFVGMAAVYALQAAIVHRVARRGESAAVLVGTGGREALG